jgi:transposase-like protein
MKRKRIYRTKEIKFKVALEAIREQKQISEIAEEYNVHPNQVTQWKKELIEKGADVFAHDKKQTEKETREQRDKLYKKVGEQQMHIDWLKKTLGITE